MSTRSAIGVMHGDKVKAVYCHWDGYLSHNGKILFENYDSPKANHLVALGNISSLGKDIGEKHPFDTYGLPEAEKAKYKGMTTFYGRDRDEDDQDFQVCHSDVEMFATFDWCEFFYVMRNGIWYVSEGPGTPWKLLGEALAAENIDTCQALL